MSRFIFFFFLLITGLFFLYGHAFSQKDSLSPRSNCIEIFYNDGYFMEGHINALNDDGLGIGYTRFGGKKKWGIEFSARYWAGRLRLGDAVNLQPAGVRFSFLTYYFSTAYLWPLINKSRLKIYGIGDLNFRGGDEEIVRSNHLTAGGFPEMVTIHQPQRDLGISIGSKFSIFPVKWLSMSADLRYTRFLYRYYTGNPVYEFDKGTTQNLLTLQLKLGVCF